jgi:hypothetical protein
MKTKLSLRLALCGLVASFTSTTLAQTWQTVDDFQYAPGFNSFAYALAKHPSGTVYAAGRGFENPTNGPTLIMSSSDGGVTWSTLPIITIPTANTIFLRALTADAAGNLFAGGYTSSGPLPDGSWSNRWAVIRSQDGGQTWSVVDDFSLGGSASELRAISSDAAGNIYAAGTARPANSVVDFWVVRKGTPAGGGGISWSTVDLFRRDSQRDSRASGVLCHPTAGLFVAGTGAKKSGSSIIFAWMVRRSLDGGASWATVDTYQLDSSLDALAQGLGADPAGNIYAVGEAGKRIQGLNTWHGVVRKSSNGGSTWATVDDFSPSQYGAVGVAADSAGSVFVVGSVRANDNLDHWIVRKNPGGVGSWSTVDDFQYVPGHKTYPTAIIAGTAENVLVAGYGGDSTGAAHWLVRRLAP